VENFLDWVVIGEGELRILLLIIVFEVEVIKVNIKKVRFTGCGLGFSLSYFLIGWVQKVELECRDVECDSL
jgi:hypothetical protein